MKKAVIIIGILFIIGAIGVGGYLYLQEKIQKENPNSPVSSSETQSGTENKESEENTNTTDDKDSINYMDEGQKEKIKNRVDILKRKVRLKGMVEDADMYLNEKSYMIAIIKYTKALKEFPNDADIKNKIGNAYFELKNYKKAYEFYSQITGFQKLDTDKVIKALVNDRGVTEENISELQKEIDNFYLSNEEKFYYNTALECVIDDSFCREKFQKYFEANKEIRFKDLQNINRAIMNFQNFQAKDLYYKATFVSSAFFENGFYFIALKTAEKVLKDKNDYKPILKIAAESAFEIGDYIDAKKYFIALKNFNSNDPEISYSLGRVYEKLNDNPLALVHYKNALENGYKDQAEIHRRMFLIYYNTNLKNKMLEELHKLLQLPGETLNYKDFNIAIYYNILHGNIKDAEAYAKRAISLYGDSEIFHAYLAWIMLQDDDIDHIEMKIIDTNIEKALELNSGSALVTMTKGLYELKKGNTIQAIIYLKKAYSLDGSGEYKSEINDLLQEIEKQRTANKLKTNTSR